MKKIMAVLCCLIITMILIYNTGELLAPEFSGDCVNAQRAFDQLPKNSVEVITYGSSHVWKGFDPRVARDEFGISLYNYGSNWQNINTTAVYFYDSLRTQKPKIAVIECFKAGDVLIDVDMNGEIFYTRKIYNLKEKRDYLRQCFGDNYRRYLSYYMPLYVFHSGWTDLSKWKFIDPTTVEGLYNNWGYLPSDAVTEISVGNWENFQQKELSKEAKEILDDIVERCTLEGISIIFYTAPYEGEYPYHNAMKQYADEKKCVYLDLFERLEEAEIDPLTDFQDSGHLNKSGSGKVAKYISEFIIENYAVSDIR